jgi:hypothetical protein
MVAGEIADQVDAVHRGVARLIASAHVIVGQVRVLGSDYGSPSIDGEAPVGTIEAEDPHRPGQRDHWRVR